MFSTVHKPHFDAHHPLWLWLTALAAFLLALLWTRPIH